MRIGIIAGEYPPMQGGVGAYTRLLARGLAERGAQVCVLTHRAAIEDDMRLTLDPLIGGWGVGALMCARRWTRARRLEIVNLQYQTAAFGMSPFIHVLPKWSAAPFITTFHDLRYPYLFPKAGRLRPAVVRYLASASAGAVVTNHEDAAELTAARRKALIPIGSNILAPAPDEHERAAWRAQAGASAGDWLIGYFGLVNRSKGLDDLLHAAAVLRGEGMPIKLALIGAVAGSSDPTNAAYGAEIDGLIGSLGLAACVHRTGYLDDAPIAGYLSALDCLALPFRDGASYRRGSLMAGLRYGCAIVTTAPRVSIPEFQNGDNMLIVPPNDSAALAAALRRLHDEPVLRSRLQTGARELAKRFEWADIAAQTLDFFQQVARA